MQESFDADLDPDHTYGAFRHAEGWLAIAGLPLAVVGILLAREFGARAPKLRGLGRIATLIQLASVLSWLSRLAFHAVFIPAVVALSGIAFVLCLAGLAAWFRFSQLGVLAADDFPRLRPPPI